MTEETARELQKGDRVEALPRVGPPEYVTVLRVCFTEGRPGTNVLIRADDWRRSGWTEPNLLALPEAP